MLCNDAGPEHLFRPWSFRFFVTPGGTWNSPLIDASPLAPLWLKATGTALLFSSLHDVSKEHGASHGADSSWHWREPASRPDDVGCDVTDQPRLSSCDAYVENDGAGSQVLRPDQ
jgi:hypothetical protein